MQGNNMYDETEKNRAVIRKDLDSIVNGNFVSEGYEECLNMSFFRIGGVTRFWEVDQDLDPYDLSGDILSSIVRYNIPFAFAIIGDKKGINIYVGTVKLLTDSLRNTFSAEWPGLMAEMVEENPMRSCPNQCGGLFTGIPTNKSEQQSDISKKNLQIESICRGMLGREFTYLILASGISSNAVSLGQERLLDEMAKTYQSLNLSFDGGAQGNITAQTLDYSKKNYLENLEFMEQYLKDGISRGMWRVNGYYAAQNPVDARQLGNLIKASYSGKDSKPEPFRIIEYNRIKEVLCNMYMMADVLNNQQIHPLGLLNHPNGQGTIPFYIYKYQTLLNSDQLAIMCQLPTKEFPGYAIDDYVEFDVDDRISSHVIEPISIGNIIQNGNGSNSQIENSYQMEKNDLTRHALVIGITGGGKTNTSKSLLQTLWVPESGKRTPFLVIESAKREYWELRNQKGFEDLLVFTLGSEAKQTSIRYRINPFETLPGISLQTHIDYLLSTFQAAFELYPPMPYVLEQAVYEVYEDRGWDIIENTNRYGLKEYPTLSNLYNKISVVVGRLGYHQEVQSNVRAALEARIHSLMIGGKGAMMNTPTSVPIRELLGRPTVLELEDLGDDEVKSFVIGILMVQLYEYRKSQMTGTSKKLEHVLMIEEAHRLLKHVPPGGDNGSRAKSVEFFCNMLAEIRTYGQGIMIADQIPTKLASDTIKNTNLKIVHRTVALEDREAMGKAMNMTQQQMEYLSSLKRGYAAVYAEGDNRPKCVKMPLVETYYNYSREEVLKDVRKKVYDIAEGYDKVSSYHCGCTFCDNRCAYYEEVKESVDSKINCRKVLDKWKASDYQYKSLQAFLGSSLMQAADKSFTQKRCIIGYILQQSDALTDGEKEAVIAEFIKGGKENGGI